ncbi:MAG: hypothetical protein JNN30_14060 [Rhodanobacteraceae bacterium]|nr:hypothetical protein [Rhodanobacteraceae bacterium]
MRRDITGKDGLRQRNSEQKAAGPAAERVEAEHGRASVLMHRTHDLRAAGFR